MFEDYFFMKVLLHNGPLFLSWKQDPRNLQHQRELARARTRRHRNPLKALLHLV